MYNNKERADEVDFWEQHNGNMTEEEKQEIRLDHLDDEDKQNEQDFNILGMSHKEFGIYAVKMGEDWRKNHPELMDAYQYNDPPQDLNAGLDMVPETPQERYDNYVNNEMGQEDSQNEQVTSPYLDKKISEISEIVDKRLDKASK